MKQNILIFGLLALLWSCGGSEPAAEAPKEETGSAVTLSHDQQQSAGITSGYASRRPMNSKMHFTGVIDIPPQNLISVSFPFGGFIKSTDLLPGSPVRKGQLIATIEDQSFVDLQQNYLVSKSKLEFLKKDFERQKELNNTKSSSDKTYQMALSEYESQRVAVKALSEKLALIGINGDQLTAENLSRTANIFSPVNGYVSEVLVNIGKYVNPTDVLFQIVNPDDVHLRLTVFENDMPKIQIGQRFTAWTNQNPEKQYPGNIILLGQKFDSSRSTEVHCHFDEFNKELLPGMFMNVDVEVRNDSALSVPSGAVVKWQNEHFVFVKKTDNIYEMYPVKVMQESQDFAEIQNDGVIESKEIILTNAYAALMQMKNASEE